MGISSSFRHELKKSDKFFFVPVRIAAGVIFQCLNTSEELQSVQSTGI